MVKFLPVLISGAGLAGLSCRLAFKRLRVKADLIDLAPVIAKPEHDEPLVLTSNATRALYSLGLSDLIRSSQQVFLVSSPMMASTVCQIEIS